MLSVKIAQPFGLSLKIHHSKLLISHLEQLNLILCLALVCELAHDEAYKSNYFEVHGYKMTNSLYSSYSIMLTNPPRKNQPLIVLDHVTTNNKKFNY